MISKISAKLGEFINWVIQKSVLNDLFESQLLATWRMLSLQQAFIKSDKINDYEFRIFSQYWDDGIIQFLIKNIQIQNRTFIEFWVEDYTESNTRFLMMNDNWSGFVMDGSEVAMKRMMGRKWYWKHDLNQKAAFIDRGNVNELLSESGFRDVGLLHIDLDGNDYWILEELDFERYNPSILIMEYNSVFGKDRAITVPYDPKFYRTEKHYSNLYFWASLKALVLLAQKKGYEFIGCNEAGNNAFFIRKDLKNEKVRSMSLNEGYRESKFRESRGRDFQLSFLRWKERADTIRWLPVVNVETWEIEKF